MSVHNHSEWKALAAELIPRHQMFINGKFEDAASGKTFASVNPATDTVLAQVSEGDAEDIDRAVIAARAAFDNGSWSRESPQHRKTVLLRLAELIRANLDELALLDSMDMGKPVEDAANVDVPGSAMFFQWYAEAIDKIYDEVAPTGEGDLALVRREPLGVIGAVLGLLLLGLGVRCRVAGFAVAGAGGLGVRSWRLLKLIRGSAGGSTLCLCLVRRRSGRHLRRRRLHFC